MDISELMNHLTYEHLSRGLLIGGTAMFLYLTYVVCFRQEFVSVDPSKIDYTQYYKG